MAKQNDKFIFKSNQTIGAAAAEQDSFYLKECFIDTGALSNLLDCEDFRHILVGRTGAGKSALIAQIFEQEENVIPIELDNLILSYVSDSGVLQFFTEAGVDLDIFYRLLWRHIFCIELLKRRFSNDTIAKNKGLLFTLRELLPKSKNYELGMSYLNNWEGSFWEKTQYKIKEVTSKLEKELQAKLTASMPGIGAIDLLAAKKLAEDVREEVTHIGQSVVNHVQIRDLSSVMDIIEDVVLSDRKKKYYITVDRLDENWVEDKVRLRLIRALIETSTDFNRKENIKIIVALRKDLIDRVYELTRDTGFQEEKYNSSTLNFKWTRNELIEILESRINVLIKGKYTKGLISHKDILPFKILNQQAVDYMLERTLYRPRDIIQFFNACISQADGQPIMTIDIVLLAEGIYSRDRLTALVYEWGSIYPNLRHISGLLKNKPENFKVESLTQSELEDNCFSLVLSDPTSTSLPGMDLDNAKQLTEGQITFDEYRKRVILMFYRVGLIGLRAGDLPIAYSDIGGLTISKSDIENDTRIYIQKTFWRSLSIGGKRQ
jgi:hypothetical protein